jgi:hypothetical protein
MTYTTTILRESIARRIVCVLLVSGIDATFAAIEATKNEYSCAYYSKQCESSTLFCLVAKKTESRWILNTPESPVCPLAALSYEEHTDVFSLIPNATVSPYEPEPHDDRYGVLRRQCFLRYTMKQWSY